MTSHAAAPDEEDRAEDRRVEAVADAEEGQRGFRRKLRAASFLVLFIVLLLAVFTLAREVSYSRTLLQQQEERQEETERARAALFAEVERQRQAIEALTAQLVGLGVDPASIPALPPPDPAPSTTVPMPPVTDPGGGGPAGDGADDDGGDDDAGAASTAEPAVAAPAPRTSQTPAPAPPAQTTTAPRPATTPPRVTPPVAAPAPAPADPAAVRDPCLLGLPGLGCVIGLPDLGILP